MSRLIDEFNIDPALIVKMSSFQVTAIERLPEIWSFKSVGRSPHTKGIIVVMDTPDTLLTVATNGVVLTTPKPVWLRGIAS